MKKIRGGLFIVFEGGEGSGKSTHAELLAETWRNRGYDVLLTKEPGGEEEICMPIRKMLLFGGHLSPEAELMLYIADRLVHVNRVIKPALVENKIVICDRFDASTYAYQVAGGNVSVEDFEKLNNIAKDGVKPHLYVWCDVSPEFGLSRNSKLLKNNRMEEKGIEYHKKVYAGYGHFFENYERIYLKMDTETRSVLEVSRGIEKVACNFLGERGVIHEDEQ